jgi:WD40 repeat protein
MLRDLLHDIGSTLLEMPDSHRDFRTLEHIAEAIGRDLGFTLRRKTTLFQSLYNLFNNYEDNLAQPGSSIVSSAFKSLSSKWLEIKKRVMPDFVWLELLTTPERPLGTRRKHKQLASGGVDYDSLTLSSDGKRVAASAVEGFITIWDTQSGDLITHLSAGYEYVGFSRTGHAKSPRITLCGVVFSPDGTRIASQTGINELVLWDGDDYRLLRSPEKRGSASGQASIPPVFFNHGKLIATVFEFDSIRVWSSENGTLVGRLLHPEDGNNEADSDEASEGDRQSQMAISSLSGESVVSTIQARSDEQVVEGLYRLITRDKRRDISSISGASNGSVMVALWSDGYMTIWYADTNESYGLTFDDTSSVSFVVSADSKLVIHDSTNRSIRVHDLESGSSNSLQDIPDVVGASIGYDSASNAVYAITQDGRCLTWRPTDDGPNEPQYLNLPGDRLQCSKCMPAGSQLVLAEQSGRVQVVDLVPDIPSVKTYFVETDLLDVLYVDAGRNAFVALLGKYRSGSEVWMVFGQEIEDEPDLLSSRIETLRRLLSANPLQITSRGNWLVGLAESKVLRVWDAATAIKLFEKECSSGFDLVVADNADRVALAEGDLWSASTLRILGLPYFEEICRVSFSDRFWRMGYSPDGRRVAVITGQATDETKVELFDACSGVKVGEMHGDEQKPGWILSLAFSPDSSTLATAGGYPGIKLWNSETGELVKVIESEAGNEKLAFSTDGRRVVVHPEDCAMLAYDIETDKCIDSVFGVSFMEMQLRNSSASGLCGTRAEIGDLHVVSYPERKVVGWLPGGVSHIEFDRLNWRCLAGVTAHGIGLFRIHGLGPSNRL